MTNNDYEQIIELLDGMDMDRLKILSAELPEIMRKRRISYLDEKLREYSRLSTMLLEPGTIEHCVKFDDLLSMLCPDTSFPGLKELPAEQEKTLEQLKSLETDIDAEIAKLKDDGNDAEASRFSDALRRSRPDFLAANENKGCPSSGVTGGGPRAYVEEKKAVLIPLGLKQGDVIEFGRYPQSADGNDKTPIEWIVRKVEGEKALLISKYALDCQPYNDNAEYADWGECSLRAWLNGPFMESAFSAEESEFIRKELIYTNKHPRTMDATRYTISYDSIFLMSYLQTSRADIPKSYWNCVATPYAISRGASMKNSGVARWWLRTPGRKGRKEALCIGCNGAYEDVGIDDKELAVRPAMWVELGMPCSKPLSEYENISTGSCVQFGHYLWNGNGDANPIEWNVLDIKDGKALLISKYVLECKILNESTSQMTWNYCSLRRWLNNDFMNAAFSMNERMRIPVTVVAGSNESYVNTLFDADTKDSIFILNHIEALKYFHSNVGRKCKPTKHALSSGVYVSVNDQNCSWWLRSPASEGRYAMYVDRSGIINTHGCNPGSISIGVRPALWVNL